MHKLRNEMIKKSKIEEILMTVEVHNELLVKLHAQYSLLDKGGNSLALLFHLIISWIVRSNYPVIRMLSILAKEGSMQNL